MNNVNSVGTADEPTFIQKIKYKFYAVKYWEERKFKKSNTYHKAVVELGKLSDDYLVKEFEAEILALVEKFGKSGQSGGSAPFTAGAIANAVKKLCLHDTLSPLTGSEDEWGHCYEHEGEQVYQNKRKYSVFMNDGRLSTAHYNNTIVFQGEEEWDSFTGSVQGITSSQPVRFPFEPKTFYVDVRQVPYDESRHKDYTLADDGTKYTYEIVDMNQVQLAIDYNLNSVPKDKENEDETTKTDN